MFHYINFIQLSVHKSRPPQLKYSTSCNTILIPHMFFCRTEASSLPTRAFLWRKQFPGRAVISINQLYPAFSCLSQTLSIVSARWS